VNSVSVRDLRNHGGEVLSRVRRGEHVVVTSDGAQVAELRPLHLARVSTSELVARRRALPPLDVGALRDDIDTVLDPGL
jgi:prevent-host-death family protein